MIGSEVVNFGVIGLDLEVHCSRNFARCQVARLAVMLASSAIDIVDEAASGERNLLDTVCPDASRTMVGWARKQMCSTFDAEGEAILKYMGYVYTSARHRFILLSLDDRQVEAVTTWTESDNLSTLLHLRDLHLSRVAPDPAFEIPCCCCDWESMAREMSAWNAVARGDMDLACGEQVAFAKILDAAGIDLCYAWHDSILNCCPQIDKRFMTLVRAVTTDNAKFMRCLDDYRRYIAGCEPSFWPKRPKSVALEMSEHLCQRYHAQLLAASGA
jgi:hypothetical protein